MKNARDPKLIRARILTLSPAFQPAKSADLLCNSRQYRGSVDDGFSARWFRVEPLERALGFALAGVDTNDITERAFRVALRDDELTRRIAHQFVIRKFHDRPLQEIQEPRILTRTR